MESGPWITNLALPIDVYYEVWIEADPATENREKIHRIMLYVGACKAKSQIGMADRSRCSAIVCIIRLSSPP